jgi:hypothetical protein
MYSKFAAGDAFQNLSYDPQTYETDLKQSTKPFLYSLDPIYANQCGDICRPSDIGYISKVGTSIEKDHSLVDTESDLKLLNYRASRAPQHHYMPRGMNKNCKTGYPGPEGGGIQSELLEQDRCVNPSDKWHFAECPRLRTEYSRVSYPVCDLKEVGVNRFQPICLDPQDQSRWEHPSELGINYRMVVKDNHRPCIPKPMNQYAALPKPLTNKGRVAKEDDGMSGLPQIRVQTTYCTVPDMEYGHQLYCNYSYDL